MHSCPRPTLCRAISVVSCSINQHAATVCTTHALLARTCVADICRESSCSHEADTSVGSGVLTGSTSPGLCRCCRHCRPCRRPWAEPRGRLPAVQEKSTLQCPALCANSSTAFLRCGGHHKQLCAGLTAGSEDLHLQCVTLAALLGSVSTILALLMAACPKLPHQLSSAGLHYKSRWEDTCGLAFAQLPPPPPWPMPASEAPVPALPPSYRAVPLPPNVGAEPEPPTIGQSRLQWPGCLHLRMSCCAEFGPSVCATVKGHAAMWSCTPTQQTA